MSSCTFFGHRECYGLDAEKLRGIILEIIKKGVNTFYVGHQGHFDHIVYQCLKELRKLYPQISVCVVLAYIPSDRPPFTDMSDTMYPPIEGHPRFAIERRNNWMISNSDFCVCYINNSWGGAHKFAQIAKRRGLKVFNIGSLPMT